MYSGFIRFKVLLEQADTQQAVQQLQRMLRSDEFTPDFLRVSMAICHDPDIQSCKHLNSPGCSNPYPSYLPFLLIRG